MSVLYIETTAILAWMFNEKPAKKVREKLDTFKTTVSSVLSIVETERSLIRAESQKLIKPSDRQKLRGLLNIMARNWQLMEITESILIRAAQTFPVEPIRTLDAIHLATALEFIQAYPDLNILSFDQKVTENGLQLGFEMAI